MTGEAPRLLERTPATLAAEAGLLPAVFAGELSGVLVRGFLSPEACAGIIDDLERSPLKARDAAPFPGVTYGDVLVVSPPDLSHYYQAAAQLERTLAPSGVVGRVLDAFDRVGGKTSASVPGGYAPVTVRILRPGQAVSAHSERMDWPSMKALQPLLNPETTLSFYMPLAAAEAGGELVIYHRPPDGQRPAIEGKSPETTNALLAAFGETRVRPGVGDLLLFDGGRFNHRVTPVEGVEERWTLGGFAGLDRGGRTVWVWS